MTLTPCKIEDIPSRNYFNNHTRHRAAPAFDAANADCIAFLAMGDTCCVTNISNEKEANKKMISLRSVIKKNEYPIKALTRKGVLYLVNTAKAKDFKI